jgi:FK506-binding protein 2
MLWKIFSFLFILSVSSTLIDGAKKVDLPPDSPLRIGIKKRATDCSIRASEGDTLTIHYVGQYYLTDEVFDSSRDRQEPLTLVLGEYLTLIGLERGLLGSCEGEIRKITVPKYLTPMGEPEDVPLISVPRDDTLVYTVEVLEIDPTSQDDDEF